MISTTLKGEMKDSASISGDVMSQADIILPTQYFAMVGRGALSGEKHLMLAVLLDAIKVLQGWRSSGGPQKRRNFAELLSWVNSPRAAHRFAFDSVCDALDIDSDRLRSRLQRLTGRSANSTRSFIPRLRLKELSRRPQMTPGRLPRGKRAPRLDRTRIGFRSESCSA